MRSAISRHSFVFPVLLTGIYVLFDLVVDKKVSSGSFMWAHLLVGGFVLLLASVLLVLGANSRARADAVSHGAHEELEARVAERTAELKRANEQLQAEIGERKRVEQSLRLSEETARALMNASLESAVLTDTSGVVLAANEPAARSLGMTADQMVGVPLLEVFPPDVAELRGRYFQRVLATGLPVHFEDTRNGQSFDIQAQPVCDAEGSVIGVAAFGLNITDRKRAESALRANEEKYRALFHNMAEGFALYELLYDQSGTAIDWRVLEVNPAYSRHTGISAAQIVGRRMSGLFPDAIPEYLPRFASVVATGVPSSFETFARVVGRHHRVSTFAAGGNRFASTIEDISERRQAEQDLRSSEEKFAKIFELSPDALVLLTFDTNTVLDVNPAFTTILGHRRSDVIGKPWQQLAITSAPDVARLAQHVASDGRATDLELRLSTQSGAIATVLVSVITLTVNDELCLLLIAHDITERKRSEEALQKAQAELARGIEARAAMEERQRLSRELHDSVSQALYGISLGINTARTTFDTNPEKSRQALDYAISLARAGLAEMRALIFELRPDSLESEGLVSALTKRGEVLRTRHELEVGLNLCAEPCLSLQVKEALYRIAQEALQNAVKHAQAGRVDIGLSCTAASVVLQVCDNGVGFDSTAGYPGHLGLRSMRERAEEVGGKLELVSAPNCGTQILVAVPSMGRPA